MVKRCSLCSAPAITQIYETRQYLCSKHYSEYFERRIIKTIEKFKLLKNVNRLLLAVSGGKDSTVLLYVMHKLFSNKIDLVGFTIDLGIGEYSKKSTEVAIRNYRKLGIEYVIIDLKKNYEFSIDDIAQHRRKLRRPPCSLCGVVKRYLMNKTALEVNADAIATGHNLDDLALFIMSILHGGKAEELAKLTLHNPSINGFVAKIKPLGLVSDKETLLYALVNGIEFYGEECPYAPRSGFRNTIIKILDIAENDHPGFKKHLVLNIMRHIIPKLPKPEGRIMKCKICGMPASYEVCSFCKVKMSITKILKNKDKEQSDRNSN